MAEENGVVRFRFTGGLAANGELNFYQLSRSQYAAARLLYTLAKYQESGRVVSRLTEKSSADIRARAPVKGSFEYDAFIFLSTVAAQAAVQLPLDVMFTAIWEHLLSPFEGGLGLKAEARIELRRIDSKERVRLSQEETSRLEILRDIEHDKEVTKRDMLGLAKSILAQQEQTPGASVSRVDSIRLIAQDLQCEINRDTILEPYEHALEGIDVADRRKLFGKARPLIAEVGLPLRSSAEELAVAVGANDNTIGILNWQRAKDIKEMDAEKDAEEIRGKIVQFHTENGYGRFKPESADSINEFGGEVSFKLLRQMRANLTGVVLDAMKEEVILGEFLVTRDQEGNVKHLVLLGLGSV